MPTGYVRVGNTAPLVGEDTQRYASFWGDGYDVYRQLRWQQIPEKQRKAFKKSRQKQKDRDVCRTGIRHIQTEFERCLG
ncbi:TPA: hypothetical protein ACTC2N_001498 [Neisseria meningitidis]